MHRQKERAAHAGTMHAAGDAKDRTSQQVRHGSTIGCSM